MCRVSLLFKLYEYTKSEVAPGAVCPGGHRRRHSIVRRTVRGPHGMCAVVRYDMLYFRRRADIYFRIAKSLGVVAVGWLRKPFQLAGHSFRPLARVLG